MRAAEMLERIMHIDKRIDEDLTELYRLQQMAKSISSPKMDGIPSGGKGWPSSKVEDLAIKMVDLEYKITDEIDDLIDQKAVARKYLQLLDKAQHIIILQAYYFNRKCLEDIAEDLGLQIRRVCMIKREALEALDELLVNYPL